MDFISKFSDYLRLFLFLKLSADSNNVMLRIADVGTSFRMNEAFTYVEIDTDIQVKALLLSNSIFTRGSGDPTKKPINYWTYNYKTIAGY